ncbi:septation protein A [Bartonella bacilliformis]|uniref:Inner membrane-spanning protein YciB n=1 Tax=Bartonella bacilliformis Ver097 TaxID=1293911 RepID=A0A072R6K6_BARBA|nr:septation protein A [Bartonella bacilliformis]KEG21281.1 intracellular septation protein A [Bartonella bacilliformis Ver097]
MKHFLFEPNSQNTQNNQKASPSPIFKFFFEMGPLIVFFLAHYKGGWLINNVELFKHFDKPIYPATFIFMVAIIIALSLSWIIARTIPIMLLISGLLILVFGFLTLWLNDDTFIKMKPTIINSLFSFMLFGSLLFNKLLLRYIFDSAFKITEKGWKKLTYCWAFFFAFLALLNEVIWRNFNDDFWVTFKVFGVVPIAILFIIVQFPIIIKYSDNSLIKDDESNS